ncbi:MAG: bifunctional riboflavin kinase/FAD synthetase [Candidatus Hydrogenedentes bacterium]|nr:bifunctional riboflavin kinase/FAD synthetase [Candidatus Hydrogenedentota bacterium]
MIRIVENILESECGSRRFALTIGSFDGVHLGHRAILDMLVRQSAVIGAPCAVLTLRPHPREFFSPEHAPSLLTHDPKKWSLFEEAGVHAVFVLPFDASIAALEPEVFIEDILVTRCHASALVVGHDFRFGHKARGDFALLEELAPRFGYTVSQVPPLLMDGERVSSTLIRERLLVGDLEKAQAFLGRPYSISGQVVTGRRIGTALGFPTANVQPHHSAIPAQGVYAAWATVSGHTYPAAVNIGVAPTIRNEDLTIEAFLLDFTGDIEGSDIEITFLKHLRSEQKFPSPQALAAQIQRDVAEVREVIANT